MVQSNFFTVFCGRRSLNVFYIEFKFNFKILDIRTHHHKTMKY